MWKDTDHGVVVDDKRRVEFTSVDCRGIVNIYLFIYLLANYVELSGRRVEAATAN
jgi:hypothetical protein